jgi:hypothetical protein
MAKIIASFGVAAFAWATMAAAQEHHVRAALEPVDDSGVSGMVSVVQLPEAVGGTNIHVVARGLLPGEEYVSLYYENDTCALEPYSEDDIIGTYVANAGGVGVTHGMLEDDLDEINSISVRRASDFTLLACANIHPAP